jgi:hypothetical protein
MSRIRWCRRGTDLSYCNYSARSPWQKSAIKDLRQVDQNRRQFSQGTVGRRRRVSASTLTHFDEVGDANDSATRTLVQTDFGSVLYDFRHHPPLAQRSGKLTAVERVFWQGDEVVMQSLQRWFRFKRGVPTKLQLSTATYH